MKHMFTGSAAHEVLNLAIGDDTKSLPNTVLKVNTYDFIDVYNAAATDAKIKLNDVEDVITVKAGTMRTIYIKTRRIRVAGAAVEVLGYIG